MGAQVSKVMSVELDSNGNVDGKSLVTQVVLRVGVSAFLTWVLFKYIDKLREIVDPTMKQKKAAQAKAESLLKQLGKENVKDLKFTEYELNVASQLVVPAGIVTSWDEIGGLEHIIDQIRETVILPFQRRDVFKMCKLFQPPKGILLYGPPGCGKTMLAKATAKASGCAFLNIEIQQLTDKWYGESQKLAAAVFSLAHKLQPAIIFIDEIDVFLQMRSDRDHEVTAMMKATFMSLWDGLVTEGDSQIMVMGATNRAQMIDQAILRRLPIRLHVPMPESKQRAKILEIVLDGENLENDVKLNELADDLHGFSGSDIREMCRHASVARVHEHIKMEESSGTTISASKLRAINMSDLIKASRVMQKSKGTEMPYLFPETMRKLIGDAPE